MKAWMVCMLIAAGTMYSLAIDPMLDLNGDSPRFVMLAQSIVQGEAYHGRFGPVDRPETQIPYLYPALLSAVVAVFGPTAYVAFKAVSVVAMLLALLAMWFWMSHWTSPDEARWIVVTAAFLTQILVNANRISTESVFLAASFACLGFMERLLLHGRTRPADWFWVLAMIGIAFHLRAAGWSLIAAFGVVLWIRRGWKPALLGTALGLAVCTPWLLRIIQYGFGYAAEFEQSTPGPFAVLYRIGYNTAANIAKSLPDLLLYPAFWSFLPYEPLFFLKAAVGLALFTLIVRGVWTYARRNVVFHKVSATATYSLIYIVGALSWTVHGERYLLPVLPVLLWAMLRGAAKWRGALMTGIIVTGLIGSFWTIYQIRAGIRPPEEEGLIEANVWVGLNAADGERVMSRYPTWTAAVTGHRGIRWAETSDLDVHRKALLEAGVTWIILDHTQVFRESGTDRLMPLIEQYPSEFLNVFSTNHSPPTQVYRFVGRR